jgi:hypothetical protein
MAVYVKDLWKEGGSPSPLNEEKMTVSVQCLYIKDLLKEIDSPCQGSVYGR